MNLTGPLLTYADAVPGWEALPPGTTIAHREHGDGRQEITMRTGTLVTSRVVSRARWGSALSVHEEVWRAWDLLMHRHWWRLAHDRGGYC